MKRYFLLLTALTTLLSCKPDPCRTKEQFIANYDKFIEDVRTHHKELKTNDWQEIDEEYSQFTEQCYDKHREEMSVSEKVKFWKNTLSYSTYHAGDERALEDLMKGLQVRLEDDLESLSDESREEIEDYFRDEVAPQLEDAIDEIIKGVEDFGEKLKEWLEEMEKE